MLKLHGKPVVIIFLITFVCVCGNYVHLICFRKTYKNKHYFLFKKAVMARSILQAIILYSLKGWALSMSFNH